mmetsp:Transcript_851/g.1659  ORF Transcript_851/g.1659 Transcript_851/m.1659 type:complete len:405 (+) Transcript_851:38-1252(+)|eukprot:CAMPEP_0175136690 /NCGR_PEP_ID=MMETSP0087-20121206/9416_1 /TAXON_ID=136419 /ORGANISM="Unknown Unknown, Strain D1" /LENGTH=404 /DNA_ID=CAMNT_0016419475 /DNA_START=38 /DNA_END=1252 /DNA_ORIENTATION=+
MGQVLSQPISNQLHTRSGNKHYKVGTSEMQGFRMAMEDEHTVDLDLAGKGVAYFGVYDGHAGQKASQYLAAEMSKRVGALDDPTDAAQLIECVKTADSDFLKKEEDREDGSTCVFCVVKPFMEEGKQAYEVIAVNVGDSRAMIVRQEDGQVIALTNDHKPEDEREAQRINEAGGTVQMNRVDGQLAMSRAIGDYQYKRDPTLKQEEQKVIPVPEIQKGTAYPGDFLFVCCDGIVEAMSNEAACACFHEEVEKKGTDLAYACGEVFKLSLKQGSKDNHSALLVQFADGTGYSQPDEFVAGPFHPYQNDKQYVKAYLADAAKHGYEGEPLMELARKTEATMPELQAVEVEDRGEGDTGLTGALQAFLSQPNGGDVHEKLMLLSQMLSSKPSEEEEDGEQDEDQNDT